MLPDWVSNPGPLTYESGALPIALRDPAFLEIKKKIQYILSSRDELPVNSPNIFSTKLSNY